LTQILKSTVERTVKHFEDTSSVKDRPRIGRPITGTTEEKSSNNLNHGQHTVKARCRCSI